MKRYQVAFIAWLTVVLLFQPARSASAEDFDKTALEAKKASAEMNLQSVQQGISSRAQFIQQQQRTVAAKQTMIDKLSSNGNLFESKIATLRNEIKASEAAISSAKTTLDEMVASRQSYQDAIRKAQIDIQRINRAKIDEVNPASDARKRDAQKQVVQTHWLRNEQRTRRKGLRGDEVEYFTVGIYKTTYDNGTSTETISTPGP